MRHVKKTILRRKKKVINIQLNEIMAKKSLSKEELIAQLKALSEAEPPKSIHMGAMCYCPMPPPLRKIKCESCHQIIEEEEWMSTGDTIREHVEEIKVLGYDAKVVHICGECVNKLGITDEFGDTYSKESLYYVFYFRIKEQQEYHIVECGYGDAYKAVLAFLRNEPSYTSYYEATHLIKDKLDVIKRMTGISIE